MNKKIISMLVISTALIGCVEAEPLIEYRPVVDPKRTNAARFESDLNDCRTIALSVQADYKKRQSDQMAANLIAGILVGAVAGAVIGDTGQSIAAGAAIGGAAGASSNDYSYDLVKYGPRRVVDRCMADRGHKILNDIGKG